ncbi:MAG: NUDIX domain-containing protein [Solirubrobacteraceae bacterium]
MFSHDHPRPMLTVDVVVLARNPAQLASPAREPQAAGAIGTGDVRQVLLIERAHAPFAGCWALPGGFVDEGECAAQAAPRELAEETGLELAVGEMELLGVFDTPARDPRGWSVSVVYRALLAGTPAVRGGDDAAAARWWPVAELPELAFDHALIIAAALAA